MLKTLSTPAQCAQAIRKELKNTYPGVLFHVTSKSYSMGDHVDVGWTDGPIESEVKKRLARYQYGHFNGMEDIYEITNDRSDIPQTKYLFCDRSASRERIQRAIDWVNTHIEVVQPLSMGEYGAIDGRLPESWGMWPG